MDAKANSFNISSSKWKVNINDSSFILYEGNIRIYMYTHHTARTLICYNWINGYKTSVTPSPSKRNLLFPFYFQYKAMYLQEECNGGVSSMSKTISLTIEIQWRLSAYCVCQEYFDLKSLSKCVVFTTTMST